MPMSLRPTRLRVQDETGRTRTLSAGPEAFEAFGTGSQPVFLGLGPDPASLARSVPTGETAGYVECPQFASAMPPAWKAAIPANLSPLAVAELTAERIARSRFFLYRQNPRLYPSFWGPILARLRLSLSPAGPAHTETRPNVVFLARPETGLLEPELARAFASLGYGVHDIPADRSLTAIPDALALDTPVLFLSINGAGLDPDGLVFSLLAATGVPVAVWCVDNPFHVLSRFRAPFWKKTILGVTDDWFLAPLRELGAASAHHLPLAASHHFFEAKPASGLEDTALFVGRSTFPGREHFFAGCRLPEELLTAARDGCARGVRADFGWWMQALGLAPAWPDKALRLAGYGAEMTGVAWRTACLGALARTMALILHGDPGWRELVPGASLAGPVDYYGGLAGCYAGAAVMVNLTSPLLPRGLTQRHFDVWAAGGVLATDATPGLALFPKALTRPITFTGPGDIGRRASELARDTALRAELRAGWREELLARHLYTHRLSRLLDLALYAQRS